MLLIIPVGGFPENWHGQIRASACSRVFFFPSLYCSAPDPSIPPDGYEWHRHKNTQAFPSKPSSSFPLIWTSLICIQGELRVVFLPENTPQSASSKLQRATQTLLSQQTNRQTDTNTNTRRSACLFIMSGFNELEAAFPTRGALVRGHRPALSCPSDSLVHRVVQIERVYRIFFFFFSQRLLLANSIPRENENEINKPKRCERDQTSKRYVCLYNTPSRARLGKGITVGEKDWAGLVRGSLYLNDVALPALDWK